MNIITLPKSDHLSKSLTENDVRRKKLHWYFSEHLYNFINYKNMPKFFPNFLFLWVIRYSFFNLHSHSPRVKHKYINNWGWNRKRLVFESYISSLEDYFLCKIFHAFLSFRDNPQYLELFVLKLYMMAVGCGCVSCERRWQV